MIARILIELDDDGRVKIEAPLDDAVLVQDLLESTKAALFAHHRQKRKGLIERAVMIPDLTGRAGLVR